MRIGKVIIHCLSGKRNGRLQKKYNFAKEFDVEWIDNFTVATEKSRL